MKTCSKCGVSKNSEDFGKDSWTKDGLKSRCRQCLSESSKKDYEDRPEHHKKRRRLQRYGLTPEAYDEMVKDQNGCCKICSQFMAPAYVDHSHVTGKVRSLLCLQCNTAIGSLKDSPELCVKASEYLKSFL